MMQHRVRCHLPSRTSANSCSTARGSGLPARHTLGAALLALGTATAAAAVTQDGSAGAPIDWRLPTEVLAAGDALETSIFLDPDFLPPVGGWLSGPNFGARMAVTHLPRPDGGLGDVIVAASISGVSMRRNASGVFEPYPDCATSPAITRNTGAVAILRLARGGLRYQLESLILPAPPEVDVVLPYQTYACEYFGGCIAGTRLALSGRSLATIAGGVGALAEAHPAVSRLRVYRRDDAGAWLEEEVRINETSDDQWITGADVDFIDEDTFVAIAGIQEITPRMDTPPRQVLVFKRTKTAGGFEWRLSPDYPSFTFTSHELGGIAVPETFPSGTGEWPRIDATAVDAGDPAGAGLRVVIGAPGYAVYGRAGLVETRGAVYNVHLADRRVQVNAVATGQRIAEGENDSLEPPLDRRVGHSVAIDARQSYFSTIGTSGVPQIAAAQDAIVAVAHDDSDLWEPNDLGDRVIITVPMLPSTDPRSIAGLLPQRTGIGFGRDMAIEDGGLVVRLDQCPYGIAGGPVLAMRFEPAQGKSRWKLSDIYETGRPTCDDTTGLLHGALAVSESGLVVLGEPTLGGGLTDDPGAAWLFSSTDDSNGDGVADDSDAEGVELVVIDEWSMDLNTGSVGSQESSPIERAVGISEQLRKHFEGQPVRVMCVRTSSLGVGLQPGVLEYSSAMQSANGSSHIVESRAESIDAQASFLPVANCRRSTILGHRPAHEAELLSDIVARWPWRARNRVVLALTHDCDQLEIPNLLIESEVDPTVVSAVVHEIAAVNEARLNLFDFLGAVDRGNSLAFATFYDQRLVCQDPSFPCDIISCIAPRLFANGAFDPTLGYLPASAAATRIRADLDNDGDVGAPDLAMLLAGWGTPSGDVTADGATDAADLSALLAAWFTNECR